MIQKLATLPIWDAAYRSELAAAFATERNIVKAVIPPNYLRTLAVTLPEVWENGAGYQRAVALVHPAIWELVQGFNDRKSVALFLLLMDERDVPKTTAAVATACANEKPALITELDDDLPF